MRVAYLVNQYPAISHTFVRREIRALEDLGIEVERVSVRRAFEPPRDPDDLEESRRTRVILDVGAGGLARALARTALRRPRRLARAARTAFSLGRRSERGVLHHIA